MLRRVAPLLFVASGVAGLLLQVAWFRLLALSLGGTLAAATIVLSTFMAGLALGAWLLARRAGSLTRPLRTYGLLEIAAGACALATLPLLACLDQAVPVLARLVGHRPDALLAVKFVLAAIILLPATTFMGGTLPALCQALVPRPGDAGLRTGGLYALNTWGAVAGTLLAIFLVMPRWGLSACVLAGVAIDIAIGVVVLALSMARREEPAAAPMAPSAAGETAPAPASLRYLAMLLFVVGAAGLAYEVLWTRALAFYFGSGAHGFSVMLAVVLVGLALGAFLGGSLADRVGQPLVVLAISQALLALAVAWQAWRMPALPDFLYELALRSGDRLTFGQWTLLMLIGAVQILLPATILMGAALPVAVRALLRDGDAAGRLVGRLYAANSIGTVPGAILAAWMLIPAIGLQRSLFAVAAANVAVGAGACARLHGRTRTLGLVVVVAMAGLLAGAVAGTDPSRIFAGSGVFTDEAGRSNLLRIEESPHGTVTLSRMEDSRGSWLSLSVDAVNVAGTVPSLLACQELQGHLPLLLHAAPRSVVHVGFGSGGTAAAVASHPEIERIDIVEINPAILRMADEELQAINGNVLRDPRVRVHLEDGRNWLLATENRFDCILSDSVHPRYRGNSALYTIEYFELCRSRLNPGGLVSTWLPIYSLSQDSLRSIVASMRAVFPSTSLWYLNSTVNEFVILVGRDGSGGIDVARMDEAFTVPSIGASLERVGVRGPADMLDYFIGQGADLDGMVDGVALHHDDRPWVELESAAIVHREASWRDNLRIIVAARRSVLPHLRGASPVLVEELSLREPATGFMLPAHVALVDRDEEGVRLAVRKAFAANPLELEPWDFFAPPPWVKAFVVKPAATEAPE